MKQHHKARRLALQALCCLDTQGEKVMDLAQEFITDSHADAETISSALSLLQGAFAAHPSSDEWLRRHARHWDLARLAMVDRNILRLAIHEMTSGQTAPKIVISEALRLAQEFSTAESARFVNGILDAVYRQWRKGGEKPAGDDRRPPAAGES